VGPQGFEPRTNGL